MKYTPKPIFDAILDHGEGPLWDPKSQQYYWVDLLEGVYYKGNPKTQEIQLFNIGEPLGVMALTENNTSVMATANGFGVFNEDSKSYTLFNSSPESNLTELRFNDGTVDPRGRFIAGSMLYDGSQPSGSLYRLNADKSFTKLDTGLRIPNGMGWNLTGDTFYMIDTLQFKMFAYDYDLETGDIGNKRTFMEFDQKDLADGMTIDTQGCFWIAFYGEGKVVKYDPFGTKVLQIDFPAPYMTSCCFGGANMNQLFVTTSRRDLTDDEKLKYPQSGRCFVVETEIKGIADPRVKLQSN